MGYSKILSALATLLLGMHLGVAEAADIEPTPIEELGELIFHDQDLSIGRNQPCAACHGQDWGGTGPDQAINAGGAVYEGSIPGHFGNRKPPSFVYATLNPILHFSEQAGQGRRPWVGGLFWNGRATGEKLGSPAADQAQGPFLNPAEHGLPDSACVVYRVANAHYADLYAQVWGDSIISIGFSHDTDVLCEEEGVTISFSDEDQAKVAMEYNNIALSIAAYENSARINQFSSKFDAWQNGKARLSKQERQGLKLFKKSLCHRCHLNGGEKPAFTDFTYANLGVPANPKNPALVADPAFVDLGLGGFLMSRGEPLAVYEPEFGKMKVPTLRNVDKRPAPDAVKAYMHNGVFKSLKEVVHFYNTRDVLPRCEDLPDPDFGVNCWPAPEVPNNVNTREVGDLGLTDKQEDAIVVFLKALTDGFATDDP